ITLMQIISLCLLTAHYANNTLSLHDALPILARARDPNPRELRSRRDDRILDHARRGTRDHRVRGPLSAPASARSGSRRVRRREPLGPAPIGSMLYSERQ